MRSCHRPQRRTVAPPCHRLTHCVVADNRIGIHKVISPAIIRRRSGCNPYAIGRRKCTGAHEDEAARRLHVILETVSIVNRNNRDRLAIVRDSYFPLPEKASRIISGARNGRGADQSDQPYQSGSERSVEAESDRRLRNLGC